MKFFKQEFIHNPANGIYGDCYRTCLAIVTGRDRDDIPHRHIEMTMQEATAFYDDFLRSRCLQRIACFYHGDVSQEQALEWYSASCSTSVPFIFSGKSKTGCSHAVIARDGKIIWDPSLTDAGIVGPMETEPHHTWMAEWIVSFPDQVL